MKTIAVPYDENNDDDDSDDDDDDDSDDSDDDDDDDNCDEKTGQCAMDYLRPNVLSSVAPGYSLRVYPAMYSRVLTNAIRWSES
ncbi:unnamed protein product [Echinostoma caproni]|uniref:Uncharacterized protein n=1 Tax=Echinostoma caproni TaxID=27848 RepID=A0A183B8W0_9TREM|nr:unnamed protein product [Echinostoma caproni]